MEIVMTEESNIGFFEEFLTVTYLYKLINMIFTKFAGVTCFGGTTTTKVL